MEEHAKVWPSQQSRGATEATRHRSACKLTAASAPAMVCQPPWSSSCMVEGTVALTFAVLRSSLRRSSRALGFFCPRRRPGHTVSTPGTRPKRQDTLMAAYTSFVNSCLRSCSLTVTGLACRWPRPMLHFAGQTVLNLLTCMSIGSVQVAFLGFSQGSMLAALLALELPKPCAGLVVLNGGMPWDLEVTDALGNTRILFVSGGCDRTVTVETTRMAKERLLELGAQHLEYLEIPDLKHEISSEVICLAADFFSQVLTYRVEIEGCIQIPKGTKVILRSAFEDCLAWSDANTATVESFVCSDEKYWIRLGEECQLLDAKGFTQQLPVQLGGSHAWVAGSSIAADGGLEWLLLAQQDAVEVKRLAPHRVQLPLGSVLRLGGLKSCAQRLRGLEGRRARLRQVLPDGRYAVEVEGEEALVRLHPRHLVP
ncbi:unnamed protein product [Durusdinium trenchii]|uniref:Phospholipase/carboxylesterase/thioesterase domain-containing protein n=1 Tax=Durusdinium trenchii TaxID=1381693 RepID=A0ABP0R3J6_9DINO